MSTSRQDQLTPLNPSEFDPRHPEVSRGGPVAGMAFGVGVLVLVIGATVFVYQERGASDGAHRVVADASTVVRIPAPTVRPVPASTPEPKALREVQSPPKAPEKSVPAPTAPPTPTPALRTASVPVTPAPARQVAAAQPAPSPPRATPSSPAVAKPVVLRPETPASTTTPPARVASTAPAAQPAAAPVAPPGASGGAAVQVGAFPTQAEAEAGWSAAMRAAPGQSAGKGKSIQAIDRNGQTLYRAIITGFDSKSSASSYCAALKAAGGNCFVR